MWKDSMLAHFKGRRKSRKKEEEVLVNEGWCKLDSNTSKILEKI